MDECKIVTDLLPTYCDELTGEATNRFIRNHIENCPDCRKMLNQMQHTRQQQMAADIRRAEFKAALAGYERKHKTRVRLILAVCIFLIAAFFMLRAFSFDLTISAADINRREMEVAYGPATGDDGRLFQILFTRTNDGNRALAYVSKNALGFWKVDSVDIAADDKVYGVADILWTELVQTYSDGEPRVTSVFHMIYAGSNANGSLQRLYKEQLPENVTVVVSQRYSDYYIHVTVVLPEGGPVFDLKPMLKEHDLISLPGENP